jgi:MFS transporter, putative metabolite:H+ symporter
MVAIERRPGVPLAGTSSGADEHALLARLEQLPATPFHRRARIIIGSATFCDAFDALSLAFALPALNKLWQITASETGILIAATYVGQLIGALFFSWLADRWGRVRSATLAILLMSIMSLGCAVSGSYATLLICRVIQGIGVGGEMPVAAAYIGELSRTERRGRFFLLYELIFPIGLMATGQVAWWLVPWLGWQSMFWVGAIPGLVIAALVFRLPESARWLIAKGRLGEAASVIAIIEESAALPRFQPATVSAPAARTVSIAAAQASRWGELISLAYLTRTIVACALWATTFFVANGLNNWMPSLYSRVYGLAQEDALRAASLTNVAQVAILLICAFTIDRIGRRRWTVTAFTIGAVLLAALGIAGANSVRAVMVLATLSYGVIGSIAAVLYLYTPEIYPTRMRAIGTGLGTSWLRLTSAVAPVLVGQIVGGIGVAAVFLMFAGISFLGALVAGRMIETRGRRLEEIAP